MSVDEWKARYETLEKDFADFKVDSQELEKLLEAENEASKKQATQTKAKEDQLRAEVQSLQRQLDEALAGQKRMAEYQRRLEEYEATVKLLSNDRRALEILNDKLEQQLRSSEDRCRSQQERLDEVEENIIILGVTIEELKEEKAEAVKRIQAEALELKQEVKVLQRKEQILMSSSKPGESSTTSSSSQTQLDLEKKLAVKEQERQELKTLLDTEKSARAEDEKLLKEVRHELHETNARLQEAEAKLTGDKSKGVVARSGRKPKITINTASGGKSKRRTSEIGKLVFAGLEPTSPRIPTSPRGIVPELRLSLVTGSPDRKDFPKTPRSQAQLLRQPSALLEQHLVEAWLMGIGHQPYFDAFQKAGFDNLDRVSKMQLSELDNVGVKPEHKTLIHDNLRGGNVYFSLGQTFEYGRNVKRSWKHALIHYSKAMQAGHADATYKVALCHLWGLNSAIKIDEKKAVELLEQAVKLKAADAASLLGYCYSNGYGVALDHDKAVQLYAADTQNPYSWYLYACCLRYGLGVKEKDEKKATELYAKCIPELLKLADTGDARAQQTIGVAYNSGDGVPLDVQKSIKWYEQAAEQGHALAQHVLGLICQLRRGQEDEKKKAFKLHQMAAEQGWPKAIWSLGRCYEEGIGVEQNVQKATELYKLAAERGESAAKSALNRLQPNCVVM